MDYGASTKQSHEEDCFLSRPEQPLTPGAASSDFNNNRTSEPSEPSCLLEACIPFPRTSGAKFSCVNILACFGRSCFIRRAPMMPESKTPRALSALRNGIGNGEDFMYMYSPTHKSCCKNHHFMVTIYDVSLSFVIKELAEKYVINITDIPAMCQYNANLVAEFGRGDLVQAWSLAAMVTSQAVSNVGQNPCQFSDIDETLMQWPLHPFVENLIPSLIQHYANQSDIQTAAMLSCVISHRSENPDIAQIPSSSKSVNVSTGESPYHTTDFVETAMEAWDYHNREKKSFRRTSFRASERIHLKLYLGRGFFQLF